MADISKITLPNGSSYDFKDTTARAGLAGKAASSHTHTKSQITDFPTIPTKTSQLTNDSGFKTTDNNTTYSLSKSGSTITLTGSDGSKTSVTDNNTTYSTMTGATSSAAGKTGLVPAPATGAANRYLRSDGTWQVPPDNNTTYGVVSKTANGLVPKLPDETTTTKYLRQDGTWAVPPNTVYTHPTTSGNKHIPAGGSSGQILRWSADGTAVWGNDNNTTYGVATSSALGLVKSGTDITVDSSGNVSVNDDSHNHVISNVDGLQSALDSKADISHAHDEYASKDLYSDTTINFGRKAGTYVGLNSTAEGASTTASGTRSHAEGGITTASGANSHAEGYSTTASEESSHAEGNSTTASGESSHAEGYNTTASMHNAHAEGASTTASAVSSHSEGVSTTASNYASHAEGFMSTASGKCSHAGGTGTKALHNNEVAYGSYNESYADTLFSIGDGTSDTKRHNAFEITTTGGKLHDKDILTSAHCIQFIPYNMKYYALNDRLLLFSNDDDVTRGIYFVNNTPNDIVVCALISATGSGPTVQYGYGTNTYPDIQNTGEGREWFSEESIQTHPTIYTMTVPTGKRGYYGVYRNSETTYTTIHDIRCPYFNYF